MQSSGYDLTIVSSNGPELDLFKNELNCKIKSVNITRKISPWQDIKAIHNLYLFFKKEKFNIIHAHTPKGGLIGMIAAFLARVPNRVYTIHGMPLETATGLKRKLLWLAEWVTCKFATKILVVSKTLKQRVVQEKICKAEKMQILANGSACGINIKKFTANKETTDKAHIIRKNLGLTENDIIIGFVGRINPDKGINCLIKSFLKVHETINHANLLLVGRIDKTRDIIDSEIMDIIHKYNNIHAVGEVKDVVPYYLAMDIFVLPSKREGFNYSLLEAAALELPTITTRATGCIDAIEESVTGMLVDIDNSEQLFNALLEMIKNPKIRNIYGTNGRNRVRDKYNARILVNEHLKLYNAVFNKTSND